MYDLPKFEDQNIVYIDVWKGHSPFQSPIAAKPLEASSEAASILIKRAPWWKLLIGQTQNCKKCIISIRICFNCAQCVWLICLISRIYIVYDWLDDYDCMTASSLVCIMRIGSIHLFISWRGAHINMLEFWRFLPFLGVYLSVDLCYYSKIILTHRAKI